MSATRHFLGWDEPVTAKVRGFLLPDPIAGPVDLEGRLIVVPTRQAGRRLREALALLCAERGTALLSAQVVPPSVLFRPHDALPGEASATVVKAMWAEVLLKLDPALAPGLFPSKLPERDFVWALRTGEMIQELRHALADGGCRLADVAQRCGTALEEPERWRNLVEIEKLFLRRLKDAGLSDPCDLVMARAEHPELAEGVREIVVAAVPDPSLLAIRALEQLSARVPVHILIHAPEELADHFDAWGRPIPEIWRDAMLDIPDPAGNAILAGTPLSQSRRVLEEIAAGAGELGPGDIAIGVPDAAVVPVLKEILEERGLPAFDPADRRVQDHPLFRLIEGFARLVTGGAPYDAVRVFLRHPDLLEHLRTQLRLSPSAILTELDMFQNTYLPFGLEDMASRLADRPRNSASSFDRSEFTHLTPAVAFLRRQVEAFGAPPFADAMRRFLQTVYAARVISSRSAEDCDFRAVAGEIDGVLAEFERETCQATALDPARFFALFLRRLGEQGYHPECEPGALDLEGWLELPWNNATWLIVTGMNDGVVPESRPADAFLPDSLRTRLGLRDDAARFARDAYLLRSLVECRRGRGRVCFIAGKTSAAGDPLKPSRLLFRCRDGELPERAARLFGPVPDERESCHASVSFRLNASPPDDRALGRLSATRLHATQFRDYLACPFRFYLKHVLQMEALNDDKAGMDGRDFGTMIHAVLERMGSDPSLWGCQDEAKLAERLAADAEAWVGAAYGKALSLPLLLALDAARNRLAAAARAQVALARDGWEIVQTEKRYEMILGGVSLSGKIDRVDRHRETGRVRILDYKTSDTSVKPEAAHLAPPSPDAPDFAAVTVGGRPRRWVDLQLPLYRLLVVADGQFAGEPELGYFNLPKAITETGIEVWEALSAGTVDSARECAAGVVQRILDRVFWPPAARVKYDDFEPLFFGEVKDYVEELRT